MIQILLFVALVQKCLSEAEPLYHRPPSSSLPEAFSDTLHEERQEPTADGEYEFNYVTSDGTSRRERGLPVGPLGSAVKEGEYSFTYPDGTPAHFRYIADENGFRVESPNLPPIPDHSIAQIEKAGLEDSLGIYNDGSYNPVNHLGVGNDLLASRGLYNRRINNRGIYNRQFPNRRQLLNQLNRLNRLNQFSRRPFSGVRNNIYGNLGLRNGAFASQLGLRQNLMNALLLRSQLGLNNNLFRNFGAGASNFGIRNNFLNNLSGSHFLGRSQFDPTFYRSDLYGNSLNPYNRYDVFDALDDQYFTSGIGISGRSLETSEKTSPSAGRSNSQSVPTVRNKNFSPSIGAK